MKSTHKESVKVVFVKKCDFLGKPRMPKDKETVTIGQSKILKEHKLIEE